MKSPPRLKRTLLLLVFLQGCDDNPQSVPSTSPTASFIVTPTSGLTVTEFSFDASSTTDREDPVENIQVRWDWEYDGTWDVDWTYEKTATHTYDTEGLKTVRLQARDTSELIDQVTRSISVRFNHLPETTLEASPILGFMAPLVHLFWSGTDSDGDITSFWIALDDSTSWYRTTSTDSVFEMIPGQHTIYAAAEDSDGQRDSSPASLTLDVPSSSIQSPEVVILALLSAYGGRDVGLLTLLLANQPDANAEFRFFLSEPTDLGETEWGLDEELRIHRRMFHPENLPLGEPPVPPELWLQSVNAWLTQLTGFVERNDLYETNGGSLDPTRWRAFSCRYTMGALFQLAGDTDYSPRGDFDFVVIEDLTRQVGQARKFLLLVSEEINCGLGVNSATAAQVCWSGVKSLYR